MKANLKSTLESFCLDEIRKNHAAEISSCPLTALTQAPDIFEEVARALLSGHFVVRNDANNQQTNIYPTCVEIYCHEERTDGLKDPIVYHRNRNDKPLPVFELGVLHNHISGIDITFEKGSGNAPESIVRASALIREFRVEGQENETRATYLYDALYGKYSLFDGFSISWIDGELVELEEANVRKNVAEYQPCGSDYEKRPYLKEHAAAGRKRIQQIRVQDERRWQFRRKED